MTYCNGHPGPGCYCEPGDPCDYHAATCVVCPMPLDIEWSDPQTETDNPSKTDT